MSYGSQLLMLAAIRSDRTDRVRGVIDSTLSVGSIVPLIFVAGGLLGLAAAWVYGYPLLAPWLVISYVAFAALAVSAVALTGPNYMRLRASLGDGGDGPLSSVARAFVSTPRFRGAIALDFVLLAVLVFNEVVKPFS